MFIFKKKNNKRKQSKIIQEEQTKVLRGVLFLLSNTKPANFLQNTSQSYTANYSHHLLLMRDRFEGLLLRPAHLEREGKKEMNAESLISSFPPSIEAIDYLLWTSKPCSLFHITPLLPFS